MSRFVVEHKGSELDPMRELGEFDTLTEAQRSVLRRIPPVGVVVTATLGRVAYLVTDSKGMLMETYSIKEELNGG